MAVINAPGGYISGWDAPELGRVSDPTKWVRRIIDRYRRKISKSSIRNYLKKNRITKTSDLDELFRRADVAWRREWKGRLDKAIQEARSKDTSFRKYFARTLGKQWSQSRRNWFQKAAEARWSRAMEAEQKRATAAMLAGGTAAAVLEQIRKNFPPKAAQKVYDRALAGGQKQVAQAQAERIAARPACGLWQRLTKIFGAKPECN